MDDTICVIVAQTTDPPVIAPHGADPPVIILNKMDPPVVVLNVTDPPRPNPVLSSLGTHGPIEDRAENVNMCMLFVVYDKIGLRWRGHYILNDEKMKWCRLLQCFVKVAFSPKARQALAY